MLLITKKFLPRQYGGKFAGEIQAINGADVVGNQQEKPGKREKVQKSKEYLKLY